MWRKDLKLRSHKWRSPRKSYGVSFVCIFGEKISYHHAVPLYIKAVDMAFSSDSKTKHDVVPVWLLPLECDGLLLSMMNRGQSGSFAPPMGGPLKGTTTTQRRCYSNRKVSADYRVNVYICRWEVLSGIWQKVPFASGHRHLGLILLRKVT